jgi:hypothetical protein
MSRIQPIRTPSRFTKESNRKNKGKGKRQKLGPN